MRRGTMMMLMLTMAVGCGGGGGGETASGGEGSSGGESSYAGPIGSEDVELGSQKYQSRCASCHEGGGPALADIHWSPEQMRRQIREGGGRMGPIPVSRLSDDEMEAVLAYLVTIGGVDN